jgi:hypothetical protein
LGVDANGTRNWLIRPIALLIAAVWCVSAVFGLLTHDYVTLEIATAPFLMMCGYVFGVAVIRPARGG